MTCEAYLVVHAPAAGEVKRSVEKVHQPLHDLEESANQGTTTYHIWCMYLHFGRHLALLSLPLTIMSATTDRSNFLRAEAELVLDDVIYSLV